MPEKENQNEVVFFLGAGASIEAGIPDTHKFIYGKENENGIQGFLEGLRERNKEKELKILEIILATFKQRSNCPIIDVELVLGTLNALNNKEKYDLIYFYDQETFKFVSEDEIEVLKILESDLKEFIRKKVVVNKDKINYLKPLIEFQKPINIFSVNYDTCIEMLCIIHKLKYTDGFDLYWNPELFEKEFDVKLFKLHGSIMWYLTDYGNYVKLPIKIPIEMIGEYRFPLYSGEIASPFILYPIGRKWEYTEPVGHLTNNLQKYLKSTELCIVVGYSFRDDDIRRIFFESAKENENLTILLISPNAGEIFKKELKYRDKEKSIESPIADRVICFNYPFGSVLKNNYLYRVKNRIGLISSWYSHAKDEKKVGNMERFIANVKTCVDVAIEDAHVYFIEKIFEKELGISPPDSWGFFDEADQFRLSYSLAIFYLLNSDEKGKKYFEFLKKYLINILEAGRQYFDLNKELMEAIEKKESDETIAGIRIKIEIWQKQHLHSTFYYWLVQDDLKRAIVSFEDFIKLQLKLEPPNVTSLLEKTALACQNFSKIFSIQYDTEYRKSPKVEIVGTKIEIEKKKDLEKGLENLIQRIEEFIDHYKQI
jgi:hypothetical protein